MPDFTRLSLLLPLQKSIMSDKSAYNPIMYATIQNMSENDTQTAVKVKVTAMISGQAKEYVLAQAKQQSIDTGYDISFSAILNRIILEHKRNNQTNERTD